MYVFINAYHSLVFTFYRIHEVKELEWSHKCKSDAHAQAHNGV